MFWPWAFEGMDGQEIIASETEVCTIRIFISEFSSYNTMVIVYNINRNSKEELGRTGRDCFPARDALLLF